MIYVTHDQIEAMTLADRIVVLNDRTDRADRHADGGLLPPGLAVRGRVRRQPGDELPRRPPLRPGIGARRVSAGRRAFCRVPFERLDEGRFELGVRPEALRITADGGETIRRGARSWSGSVNGRWCMCGCGGNLGDRAGSWAARPSSGRSGGAFDRPRGSGTPIRRGRTRLARIGREPLEQCSVASERFRPKNSLACSLRRRQTSGNRLWQLHMLGVATGVVVRSRDDAASRLAENERRLWADRGHAA